MAKFKWIGPHTFTRSKSGTAGAELTTDHIYDVDVFSAPVVDEWIATGFAEAVNGGGKDTTLVVKSPTIKIKAPKIGEEV
jgi:hypothetical protein